MPKFFVPPEQIYDEEILILGEDARHISHSLRMSEGEKITVCDMNRHDYECVITTSGDIVKAKIISSCESKSEPPYKVRLFQSLPKGDKLDFIVQKAVEIGVSEIIPVYSKRCIVKPEPRNADRKTERLRKISYEAAKQSGRGIIPFVGDCIGFESAITAVQNRVSFICYEGKSEVSIKEYLGSIRSAGKDDVISFFIGPEGGYENEEIEFAASHGVTSVGLGKRILRCETASGFVLSAISYELEIK